MNFRKIIATAAFCSAVFFSTNIANAKTLASDINLTPKAAKATDGFAVPTAKVMEVSEELNKKIQAAILKNEEEKHAGYWARRTRTVYVPRTRVRTRWVRKTRWVRRTRWVPRRTVRTVYVPKRVTRSVYVRTRPRRRTRTRYITRTVYVRTRARRRVRVRYRPVRRTRVRTIYYEVCPE